MPKTPSSRSLLAGFTVLAASLLGTVPAQASPTATSNTPLALTPPMGWNDWAHYGCDVTESTVVANADALVSTGLAAKGYNTVTVDDCWMARSRSASGHLVADPAKFPHGMAWLGSYLHSKGLKFGIYEDAGTQTCGGYPGSGPNHFATDARDFASWAVDYLKLDGCNVQSQPGMSTEAVYRQAYQAQAAALRSSGRAIIHSVSAPAYFQGGPNWLSVIGWSGQVGQLWREGADIAMYGSGSRWGSVMYNYGYNKGLTSFASPGNWNDPDFIIAGDGGLNADESRSQVALWAMMAAPLILSSDVTRLSSDSLAAIGNSNLIAVDQDPAGHQATVASSTSTTDVLVKQLANGDRAVAVLNRTTSARPASVSLSSVGMSGCVRAKDLWTGATSTTSSALTASIPAHGTAVWRLSAANGCVS
ncbi:glycoside hydrolase family 27 protein [Actinocrispum wychmicini]|uniref:Alpha-galactosidase n=1 Tax=Actinocrispum wychmicini TaxID=1213861 RepID=A0A4R2JQ45_9PSEU|nr:glycoside hydrolase family 27 protein [Actinocrispum wychmicini]TCO61137.1 alpha-galactosidase [Actinocrispum wychmicini]